MIIMVWHYDYDDNKDYDDDKYVLTIEIWPQIAMWLKPNQVVKHVINCKSVRFFSAVEIFLLKLISTNYPLFRDTHQSNK